MKLFFDFLPIIIFFIAYYVFNIYVATASAIGASLLQVGYTLVRGKKPEMMHWLALVMIVVLGSATLLLKNEIFIKWKPTAVYWLLALVFLFSQFVSKKCLVQRMLEQGIQLPPSKWSKLNLSWVIFFTSMGFLNLYVVYHFDTNVWVNFKLFGSLILTFLFVLGQGVYLMKYMPDNKGQNSK